ncbi:MAG TPA: SpaH/EbpB family LPXTG-anchored major pilin [Candidatus Mediterraneibacter stercoripullorum]|nr:SpaH/EbpB family LPXTG-anchored major pilin [Candidatus Mediterraneibacter stercoripullorum]
MRKIRKLIGLLLAAAMVFTMSAVAFADDSSETRYSITIKNEKSGHTYEAYQIFSGDLKVETVQNADGSATEKRTLSNIEWGNGINGEALLGALKGTTAFRNCEDAADVADVLENYRTDSSEIKAFADIAGQHLTTRSGFSNTCVNGEYTITDLEAGYYLVKDLDKSLSGVEGDAYTDFILKVVDDTEAQPKSDVPSVEKKVQEDDKYKRDGGYGEGYNDVADWNIGDDVPFKLIGTVPDNLDDYKTYKYIFHDTLSAGLTLNVNTINVYVASNKEGTDKALISKEYYRVRTSDTADKCSFEVAFVNLKAVPSVTAGKYIIVEYTAKLNERAEIGLPGNPNKVYLEFSNNPNSGGEGDTGKTPEDEVIVFTYELDVTKISGEEGIAETPLPGAEFKLYRQATGADGNTVTEYVIVNVDGKVTGWTQNEADGSVLTADANGQFKVSGLDDGTYYLKETKAPDGYNLNSTPIKIEIDATTNNGQNWAGTPEDALTNISVTDDSSDVEIDKANTSANEGKVSIKVKNYPGSDLPETGGMGTRVIYALGVILVLGSGAVLIARKYFRKSNK